ncbi:SURF1 family protein [Arenibacterium sp. CAU 1754]
MNRIKFLLFFGLAGTAVLVALGVWQMQRLDWKEGVLSEIEQKIKEEPVPLPDTPTTETDRYLSVIVEGTILPGELHVLVSMKRVGAGYRIIAPFLTEDGRRILLDRGFARQTRKDAVRALGPARIEGNLHWPRETDSYTPAPDPVANTWFARDVDAMARALDTEPVLLIAASQTDEQVAPLPVDTAGIPNDHLQYAITWFSLALIWAGMTTYFMWRTRAQKIG